MLTAGRYRVSVERNVEVPMRDGAVLRADLYLPDGPGSFPALVQRTPYNKAYLPVVYNLDPLRAAGAGYAVLNQDTRGRFASDGDFRPFRDEAEDGYDTVEWAAAQPWCRSKVGMLGSSYVGANSLRGDGALSTEPPGDQPPDVYLADPYDPVPTRGGQTCCYPAQLTAGAYDQRVVEERPDVLVYSTPPLERDLEVTGSIEVVLYASNSAPDADFTAKLVDVAPDGYARNLTDGILRGRYREGTDRSRLLEPGRVCEYRIDAGATSNLFRRGHRIRLEIVSSNFPRFDRNPQTGEPAAEASLLAPALQTVHHDRAYPSRVILPVVRPDG